MNFFLLAADVTPPQDLNFGMLALRMFFFLGIVLVLIYFVLRKVLPFFMQSTTFRNRTIRIVERVPVDQKRSLLVVEIQERFYLLGSAEGQINVLMELDREKIVAQPAAISNKNKIFDDVIKKAFFKPKLEEPPAKYEKA
jgi:flagellar biosynthetic protein FliO